MARPSAKGGRLSAARRRLAGTVPVESSVAHNMRARASKAVAGEHTHLMMAQETLEFMMQALYDRL